MQKLVLLAIVFCYTSITVIAQHDHSSHQKQTTTPGKEASRKVAVNDQTSQKQLTQLLSTYYNIKNALVTGDASSAATNATQFVKTINSINFTVISEGDVQILAKDAGQISRSKDLKKQREYFVSFSSNMVTVARSLKLDSQPIYLQHCPMKKASWLSSEKQIRNPYYGSAMLACGEVTETL